MTHVLPDVSATRSRIDEKQYRQIILPNGLHAVLCSDTQVMKSKVVNDYYSDDDDSGMDDGSDDSDCDDGNDDGYRKAACAMVVGCGSYFDPPSTQGLAHYLEHMLFMGSKKYPGENQYDETMSKMGGDTNAYTEMEHTVFHFEVNQGNSFEKVSERQTRSKRVILARRRFAPQYHHHRELTHSLPFL